MTAWMRNASPFSSPIFSARPRRSAIIIYTASLVALVLFTSMDFFLRPRSYSLVASSSQSKGQELPTSTKERDMNEEHLSDSSSRYGKTYMFPSTIATRNKTKSEVTRVRCSISTKRKEVSKNLVSLSDFYSPKSRCKHNFRSSVIFFHVGEI